MTVQCAIINHPLVHFEQALLMEAQESAADGFQLYAEVLPISARDIRRWNSLAGNAAPRNLIQPVDLTPEGAEVSPTAYVL